MAKLIMWSLMTLDGFVGGQNLELSGHFDVWGEKLEHLSIERGKNTGRIVVREA